MTEENVAGDAESVPQEPRLVPEMEKYMALVLQQREKEKVRRLISSGSIAACETETS